MHRSDLGPGRHNAGGVRQLRGRCGLREVSRCHTKRTHVSRMLLRGLYFDRRRLRSCRTGATLHKAVLPLGPQRASTGPAGNKYVVQEKKKNDQKARSPGAALVHCGNAGVDRAGDGWSCLMEVRGPAAKSNTVSLTEERKSKSFSLIKVSMQKCKDTHAFHKRKRPVVLI